MRLIIKEYLQTLKEKDELDLLLCDLLLLDGYNTHNIPKTGERQYGVDILATKDEDVYLFVLKQQNITRQVWDSSPDSVRQSLNDIIDVYLMSILPNEWKKKKINIVLATNGYLADSVRINWESYIKSNGNINDISIYYDFWNIDKFVDMCEKYAFNETIFGEKQRSELRKVLYYMDESDFDYRYFEKLIDEYINEMGQVIGNTKKTKKYMTSMVMCISIMTKLSCDSENYKIAISIVEYSMIKFWKFLLQNNLLEKEKYILLLIRIIKLYDKYNIFLLETIQDICEYECGIPFYNTLEHRFLLFDIIGRLSSYGLYRFFNYGKNDSLNIVNIIIELINGNPDYKYPVYDNHIIELSMLFFLLFKSEKYDDLITILHYITSGIECNYYNNHKIPAPSDTFDEAISIEFQEYEVEYKVTLLFGVLIDWLIIINDNEGYNDLAAFIKKEFPNMNIQIWQVNCNEELVLYDKFAANQSGVGISLDINIDHEEQKKILLKYEDKVDFNEMSFIKYSFPEISIISSRYYRYPILRQFWRAKI